MLSYIWIVFLGIREACTLYFDTVFLTIFITVFQLLDLLLLMQKQNWRTTWYHVLLCVLVLIVLFNKDTMATVNILLSVILLKDKNIKKVCIALCIAYLIEFFVWFAGFGLGYLKDVTKMYSKGMTHTLGFKNSNTLGLLYLQLTVVLGTTCLLFSKNRLMPLLLLIPEFLIFKYTLSRTSLLSVSFFLFLVIYFWQKRKYRLERKLMITVPVLFFCIVFFVSLSIKFSYAIYAAANVLTTGRARMVYTILDNMNAINYILGYKVVDSALDNAYLGILVNGGIFSLILFFSCSVKGLKNMNTQNFRIFVPLIFTILLVGLSEGVFSLFRLSTVLFYKILIDQFEFKFIKSKYIGVRNG